MNIYKYIYIGAPPTEGFLKLTKRLLGRTESLVFLVILDVNDQHLAKSESRKPPQSVENIGF